MILINSTIFHKTRKESIDSKTDGFFRRMKKSIDFYSHDGNLFATLVHTDTINSSFFVSSSRQDDGRKRYLFGLSDPAKKMLGLNMGNYRSERKIAEDLASEFRTSLIEGRKINFPC